MTRRDNGSKPSILVKITLSIVLAMVVFGVSVPFNNLRDATAYNIGLSLFVGGIGFVVQFLYDVEKRLEQMAEAYAAQARMTAEHITDGFKKINGATELYGLIEGSVLNTDAMTRLVRHSTRIRSSPSLLFDFAQGEIARLSDMLMALGAGNDVAYEGEDRDWLLGLTRVSRESIVATSLTTVDARGEGFVDGGLWASDLGLRYLDEQRQAIQRGIQIRRIFIMDRSELFTDPDFVSICRAHEGAGIDVRILDPSVIPTARRDSLFDFIIFDSVLVYETTPVARAGDPGQPVILNTRLITHAPTVKDRILRFQDLWRAGKPQSQA